MANTNFTLVDGLTCGPTMIFGGNGDIVTTGNVSVTGGGTYLGISTSKIYSGTSNVVVTGTNVFANISGTPQLTVASTGVTIAGALTASGITQIANSTVSTSTTTGALQVTGGAGIGGNVYVGGAMTIGGNLTINGTTTTINNTTVETTEYVNSIDALVVRSVTMGNIGANHIGTGTYLTSLNASNLSSGTVPSAQISGSYTGITGVGTIATGTWQGSVIGTSYISGSYTGITGVGTIATGTWQGSAIGASYVSTLNQNTTGSAATFTSTSQNSQFNSVGVGTAGSSTAGEIRATNNITAYYSSDAQFKENVQDVPDALSIVTAIGSKLFDWTDAYIADHGGEDGYFVQKSDFGVIAQDVQRVFPQAIRIRPDGSLAVDYEKLATLSFGAIGQLLTRIEILESKQG